MPRKKLTIEEFIERAKKVHGSKYDYSKVEYVNSHTKVCIICPEHGIFWQEPIKHVSQKNGCPMCANNNKFTTEEFIKKARLVHGDKYDYSKVVYVNRNKKVYIIDNEIGEFWQSPVDHLNGHGPSCLRGMKIWKVRNKITTEEFIKRAKQIHGNKYDYSKVIYNGMSNKVEIICKKCGKHFLQTPNNHINQKNGCPKCNESKLEESMLIFLEKNNINYEQNKHFDWLGRQHLDFYLPDYNTAIECQGIQHYIEKKHFGGGDRLIKQIESDKRKLKLCEDNGVNLFYYSTYLYNNINSFENKDKLIESIKVCHKRR